MGTSQGIYGFASRDSVDWSKYVQYRPIYQPSFYQKIFDYHTQKPETRWSIAHDVGAGAGIVSRNLASRFEHVVVSDPNDYQTLAHKALVEESGIPESTLTFLQEPAEHSSVKSSSVDLITACECIHWTDAPVALDEFHRQLKPGGTLLLSYYTRPLIPDKPAAERAWIRLFEILSNRAFNQIPTADRACRMGDSGLTLLEFPEDRWLSVERIYVNTGGSLTAFNQSGRSQQTVPAKDSETVEWVENDTAWIDHQGVDSLKRYVSTFVPPVPESDVPEIWATIEADLGGQSTRTKTPVAVILATKRVVPE